MRTVSMKELKEQFPPLTPDPEDGSYLDHQVVQMADTYERPDEILELVDKQLRAFGLEVVEAAFQGDAYVWFIAPYEAPAIYSAIRSATEADFLTKNQCRVLNYIVSNPDRTEEEILKEVFPNSIHDRTNTVSSALQNLVIKGVIEQKVPRKQGIKSWLAVPNAREAESKLVCSLLAYILPCLKQAVPNRIKEGADHIYGSVDHLDKDTDTLCSLCRNMTDEQSNKFIYDGRIPNARKLADWWEHHQEADRKCEAQEAKQRVVKACWHPSLCRDIAISPADLRKLTEAAVARGQQENEDELARIAEEQKREQRKAELEAEGVVMQIPSKCEKEARSQRSHAIVMGLKYNKHHNTIDNLLKPTELKGAAAIVWQYCVDAKLQPTLEYWWSGDGMESGFNIVVHW